MNESKEEIKRDTPIDVFNGILKLARESGNFKETDEILDYAEASHYEESSKRPITNCEIQTTFEVDFGGSEGIYIDAFLVGSLDERGKHEHIRLGTLKTLESDLHGMEVMGKTCGILQYYAHEYFSQNWRKFEPDSAKLNRFDPGDMPWKCPACHQGGHLQLLTQPDKRDWRKGKEQFALRCENCGLETSYHDTPNELQKAWRENCSWLYPNGTILMTTESLHNICKFYEESVCHGKCGMCPQKLVKELRSIQQRSL